MLTAERVVVSDYGGLVRLLTLLVVGDSAVLSMFIVVGVGGRVLLVVLMVAVIIGVRRSVALVVLSLVVVVLV